MQLPSQQPTSTKRDLVPMFTNKSTLPAFIKGIHRVCNLQFGETGQNVIADRLATPATSCERPHYNSQRIHPTTKEPIPHTRLYAKDRSASNEAPQSTSEAKSQKTDEASGTDPNITNRAKPAAPTAPTKLRGSLFSQAEQDALDEDAIPLTEQAQAKLDRDTAIWDKQQENLKKENKISKVEDDACATLMNEHVGPEMMQQIEISPSYAEWRSLPHSSIDRSVLYIRMLKTLFSSGNSTEAVDAMSRLFNLKQTAEQAHPSSFFNNVLEEYAATISLIEDKDHPGMINGLQLQSMVIINGLNKHSSANKDGIKKHLEDYPEDALARPSLLIAACLKAHQSDLNTDRLSEQSSAFSAKIGSPTSNLKKPHAAKWEKREERSGNAEIPGAIHCANCHKLTKLFFYNHKTSECNRTAASEKARQEKFHNKLHAKAAEVEGPPGLSELDQLKLELRNRETDMAVQHAYFAGKFPSEFEA